MEGVICRLPEVIRIKKKYRCYLYVDEAHSIGALGPHGKGVCDHWGVDPAEVDLLMGTFTKSFASVGGYIAGDAKVIKYLRSGSFGQTSETSMVPGTCQQAISALELIIGKGGTDIGQKKIQQLRDNSNFFRNALIQRGFRVVGDPDSPIIPVLLFYPAKIAAFSREATARKLALVVVGYPATPILLSRVRVCISAAHTREDLERAVEAFDEIGTLLAIKY